MFLSITLLFYQNGCKNGFVVEGNLDLQNALNGFRPQGCPVLAE